MELKAEAGGGGDAESLPMASPVLLYWQVRGWCNCLHLMMSSGWPMRSQTPPDLPLGLLSSELSIEKPEHQTLVGASFSWSPHCSVNEDSASCLSSRRQARSNGLHLSKAFYVTVTRSHNSDLWPHRSKNIFLVLFKQVASDFIWPLTFLGLPGLAAEKSHHYSGWKQNLHRGELLQESAFKGH